VIGAPFYVMDFVDGRTYRSADDLRSVGPERTAAIGRHFVEALVAIHAVVASDVGLGDFGRPEGFLARQVRRWKKQLDASYSRPLAGADELYDELARSVPTTDAPAAIVHGDYRLDNLIFHDTDQVAAVVDWEMATLGDPLTDVGLILAYEQLATLDGTIADACTAPGFLAGSDLLEAYSTASGRPLEHMGFYAGLASYKLATVLEGIHFRHLRGQTTGSDFSGVGSAVDGLIAFGIQSLTTR
jgi:aminoglycoside phosphotransferase (APT) family kinase protein